jgi:phosphatidylserine/phosphatidylglycerophosphate/cardiolipin synthase-like enzyme
MTLVTCALGPDSAGTLVTGLLNGARQQIDASIYEVGPSYRWAFVEAARRGRRVRLMLDHHPSHGNAATARQVIAAGGACRVPRSGDGAAHAKLIVVDDDSVAVGTGNLIWRDAPRSPRGSLPPRSRLLRGTREWWVVVTGSTTFARAARAAFSPVWDRGVEPPPRWQTVAATAAPTVGTPRPQVSPMTVAASAGKVHLVTGGGSIATVLLELIQAASRRVLLTVPYVSGAAAEVRPLLLGLGDAVARGADVRLLLGDRQAAELAIDPGGRAIPQRWMDAAASTRGHAKGVIVDDRVVVSSANWSSAGLGANWEAALVVDMPEAAAYYAAAWGRDWDCAARPQLAAREFGG